MQCFSIFTEVCTQKHPEKIQDMLVYLALVIEAGMEYERDGWLGYDRRFRQNAAASPDAIWARIDLTLRNMAFVSQAKVSRCLALLWPDPYSSRLQLGTIPFNITTPINRTSPKQSTSKPINE